MSAPLAKRIGWSLLAMAALYPASALAAPQLLCFPYHARIGDTDVLAERPINQAAMTRVLARTGRLIATSPLATEGPVGQRIFLTNGGWRWRVLALNNAGGFALTRPLSDVVSGAVIVDRSDSAQDKVMNGRAMGGVRTLSGTIAHERMHMLIRKRLDLIAAVMLPQWKAEGYPDYIAQESSLSDADVARLRREGRDHPALPYYWGRRRVADELTRNGGDVDALLGAD